MSRTIKRAFDREYKHLVKTIDRCGKRGIVLEDAIITLINDVLYQTEPKNGYDPSSHHHLAILLVKLLILHYPENVKNPKYGSVDCASLINSLVKLSGYPVALREEEQSEKFCLEIFRPMLYQQLYLQRYQRNASLFEKHLRRQETIFSLRKSLLDLFQEKSGISVADFTQCCLRCAQLLDRQIFLTEDNLSALPNGDVFLSLVSRTTKQLKSFLRDENTQIAKSLQGYRASRETRPLWADSEVVQFWEESPLMRYPLLQINGRHYSYSPSLLKSVLSNFAYAYLKSERITVLKEEDYLGGALEQYVNEMLKTYFDGRYLWLDGEHKKEAKKAFSVGGNRITDFLVAGSNDILLIEVKAQDPRTRLNKIILDSTRYGLMPIIEAVDQGLTTAKWIKDSAPQEVSGVIVPTPARFFHVVITYDEFYVPNGRVLTQTGAADDIVYTDYLPRESVFCMALDQLEHFLETITENKLELFDILKFASERVAVGDDRIQFKHYVSEYFKSLTVTLPEASYAALNQKKKTLKDGD